MPSSSSFTGIGLSLQSVTPILVNTALRVRFTNEPKASNSAQSNDALNPLNWTLTGPGFIGVSFITPVGGDSQAVDITLTSRIPAGSWTISVTNVQTVTLQNLTAPTSLAFTVEDIINTSAVNPGSVNADCEDILRNHLNPALAGPGWDALVAGVASGDCPNFDNNSKAFNQLYINTSSGIYLDRISANDGITRPKNVGMADTVYRQLAVKLKNHKVTNEAVLEVLEVYYGEDAVRAHATTDGYQPYALTDGDDLNVTIDGIYTTKIVFKHDDFTLIGAASAAEVAGAITRAFMIADIPAYAKAFVDTLDGKTKVKIYTGSLGLKGSVQIKGSGGGKAQNILKFEDLLSIYTGTV